MCGHPHCTALTTSAPAITGTSDEAPQNLAMVVRTKIRLFAAYNARHTDQLVAHHVRAEARRAFSSLFAGSASQSLRAIEMGATCIFDHQFASFPWRCSSPWCLRQRGTVNSSLTFRPKERGCAIFKWCASQGLILQMTHGCQATKPRCALLRLRTGSVSGVTSTFDVGASSFSFSFEEGASELDGSIGRRGSSGQAASRAR